MLMACATRGPVSRSTARQRPLASLAPLETQLISVAVDSIAARWADSTALCLEILGGPAGPEAPPEALLRALRTRQRPVAAAACPPTYASMIAEVDSRGRVVDRRPPGYVDPYVLSVGRPQFAQESYGWIHVREAHGTAGRAYLCTVQQVQGRSWAWCEVVSSWVS